MGGQRCSSHSTPHIDFNSALVPKRSALQVSRPWPFTYGNLQVELAEAYTGIARCCLFTRVALVECSSVGLTYLLFGPYAVPERIGACVTFTLRISCRLGLTRYPRVFSARVWFGVRRLWAAGRWVRFFLLLLALRCRFSSGSIGSVWFKHIRVCMY